MSELCTHGFLESKLGSIVPYQGRKLYVPRDYTGRMIRFYAKDAIKLDPDVRRILWNDCVYPMDAHGFVDMS